jgi:chitinase
MSYDAGVSYQPSQALKAFQHYYKGPITMGIEVPPEAWGGHETTPEEINALAKEVLNNNAAGLMLWSIQKQGPAQLFATQICKNLGLSNCERPMY